MKTKIQLEVQMLEQLALIEENLAQHYYNLQRDKDLVLARKRAKEFFKGITQRHQTIFSSYNAVLNWCIKLDKTDSDGLNAIREGFIAIHKVCFKENIFKAVKDCNDLLQLSACRNDGAKANFKSDIDRVNHLVKTHADQLSRLKQEAKKLTCVSLRGITTHDDFQRAIRRLKEEIHTVVLPGPRLTAPLIKMRSMPVHLDLVVHRQKTTLANLEASIKQYKAHLAQESYFTQAVKSFSPARKRRLAALKDFDRRVASISDTDLSKKYAEAEAWLTRHALHTEFAKKSTSRLFNNCLSPFHEAMGQNHFCQLTVVQQDGMTRLKFNEETLINAIKSHNLKLKMLDAEVRETEQNYQKLHEQANSLLQAIDAIQDTAFGYLQGNTQELHAKQQAIIAAVEEVSPQQQAAVAVQCDLVTMGRYPTDKKIDELDLAKRVSDIASDPKAVPVVHAAVQTLIDETHQHGGKGNNFQFTGTHAVERVVTAIGTLEQKEEFSRKKHSATLNRTVLKKNNTLDVAQQLVRYLSIELESGRLNQKLTMWADAYKRHKSTDPTCRTPESESIYKNKVQKYIADAQRIHKAGHQELYDLVQGITSNALITSQKEHGRELLASTLKLTVENISMLVLIFGTADQLRIWETVSLPLIAPKTLPLQLEKAGAVQQHLTATLAICG